MAAFSQHQYHPFLFDSSFLFNGNNTPPPPPPSASALQEKTCSTVTLDQPSSANNPSPFHLNPNSPDPDSSSVVVDTAPMEFNTKRQGTSANAASSLSKGWSEGRRKKQKRNNGVVGVIGQVKGKEGGDHENKDPPTGYIHVRARRGQATDSHSLAERVRREKISERMKMLQRLVPGCDKVTGKALVLDEIINYVQSLQNQVEFLSMKLASLNPLFFDFPMDLDTLFIRPDHQKLNIMASPSPSPVAPQCSPNQGTTYAADTTTTTFPVPAANNSDYLLDYSSPAFLQGQRSSSFSEYAGGQIWEVEDQRQKPLHPYGLGNNLCSLN